MGELVVTDEQLLRQYVDQQSQAAFEQLARQYGSMVYAAAKRHTRTHQDAEDVAQAVFMVLAKKAGSIQGKYLPGWLIRTTDFAARTLQRERSRRAAREREAFMRTESRRTEEGESGSAMLEELDSALLRLSESDRSAVLLRFVRGMSFPEVGLVMGLSEEAARKRVSRAIERLRSGMTGRGLSAEQVVSSVSGAFVETMSAALTGKLAEAGAATMDGATSSAGVIAAKTVAGMGAAKAILAVMIVAGLMTAAVVVVVAQVAAPDQPQTTSLQPATAASTSPTTAPKSVPAPVVEESGHFIDPPLTATPPTDHWNRTAPEDPNASVRLLLADGKTRFAAGGTLNTFKVNGEDRYRGAFHVALYEIATGQQLGLVRGEGYPVHSAAVTPDGRRSVFSMIEWNKHGYILRVGELTGADAGKSEILKEGDSWCDPIAITEDGTMAATAYLGDGQIDLWDLNQKKKIRTIDPAMGVSTEARGVGVLTFDRLGKRLFAGPRGTRDSLIRIWSLSDGTSHTLAAGTAGLKSMSVSRDGLFLASADADGMVRLWVLSESKLRWKRQLPMDESAKVVAFSPDGAWLMVTSDAAGTNPARSWERQVKLRVFEVATGRPLARFEKAGSYVRSARFSPDGQSIIAELLSVTSQWPLPDLLEIADAPPPSTQPAPGATTETAVVRIDKLGGGWSTALSADATRGYAGCFNGLSTWKLPQGQVESTFQTDGHVALIRPEFDLAVVTGSKNEKGFVYLHRLSTGEKLIRLGDPGMPYVDAIALSSDGKRVALAAGTLAERVLPEFNPEISLWDVETGKRIWREATKQGEANCMAFSMDGKELLVGGGSTNAKFTCRVRQLDAATGKHQNSFWRIDRPIISLVPSRDGRFLWGATSGGPVVAWRLDDRHKACDTGPIPSEGPYSERSALAVSPDGKRVALGLADSNIYLIDASTGKLIERLTQHEDMIMGLSFSEDGRQLLSVDRNTMRLWNLGQ